MLSTRYPYYGDLCFKFLDSNPVFEADTVYVRVPRLVLCCGNVLMALGKSLVFCLVSSAGQRVGASSSSSSSRNEALIDDPPAEANKPGYQKRAIA